MWRENKKEIVNFSSFPIGKTVERLYSSLILNYILLLRTGEMTSHSCTSRKNIHGATQNGQSN